MTVQDLIKTKRIEEWVNRNVCGADVSEQLHYFNTNGLSEQEADAVYQLIVNLGDKQGNMWEKGNCTVIPDLTISANRIYEQTAARFYFEKLIPKRYIHNHFFWAANAKGSDDILIIDPTGVTAVPDDPRALTATPYFGLLKSAPQRHKMVYSKMKDMDDWGVSEFPPGFHP